jgi:hypothetical protein
MRTTTITKTIKTICGKTISFIQETGQIAKAHSITGPAITYSKEEKKSPEYYLFGIKYSRADWQDLLNQTKAMPVGDAFRLD